MAQSVERRAETGTRWGARAAGVYTEPYAERYRAHDETARAGEAVSHLAGWLRAICERFGKPIDVLDLGCGTGRYFHALANVKRLVGIDVSRPMLERAKRPVGTVDVPPDRVNLIEDDFLRHEFEPGEFDLVYAIGVLGEHSPLDDSTAARVARWLAPGGRFAFTAVHPSSPTVPRTLKRRVAERIAPLVPAAWRRTLRERLLSGGLYADEARVRDVVRRANLVLESVEPFESDVHLHVLAVARKP